MPADFLNPLLNFYQAQMTGALKIAGASLAGLDRIEHLSLKTLREASDNQLSLAEAMADGGMLKRGELPAAGLPPVAEHVLEFQRELAMSLAEMTGALFNAYVAYVQGMNTALAQSASSMAWAKSQEGAFSLSDTPMAVYEEAQKQWQGFAQQMATTSQAMLERTRTAAAPAPSGNGKSKSHTR